MVFNYTSVYGLLLGVGILMLPGCKRPHYTPYPLTQISLNNADSQTINDVTLSSKALTKLEAQTLFDGRGSRLLRKRKSMYPYYLTITNQNNHTMLLDPKNIQAKLTNPQAVAARLYAHTNRRILGWLFLGIAGATVSLFAAAYLTIVGAVGLMPSMVKGGYAALGISGIFAVGGPTLSYHQGYHALQTNDAIDRDVKNKMLINPIEIEPSQTITVLIFISHRIQAPSFALDLIDLQTKEKLSFTIPVTQGDIKCKRI